LSWWLGPKVIGWLKRLKFGQDYADKAEEAGGMMARVLSKKGTPTMGGLLIITVLNLTTLLWAQWNTLIQLTLLSVLVLTALGFYDDYAKIIQQSGGGPNRMSNSGAIHAGRVRRGLPLKLPATSSLRLSENTSSIETISSAC
jgi:phospho-N-acetylmuramoyl-pentapeptide-transferase